MGALEIPPSLIGLVGASDARAKQTAEGKKAKKAGFGSLLKRTETDESEGSPGIAADDGRPLSELLDGVTSLGDELRKNPSLEAIRQYKDAVKRFMGRVVHDAYDAEEKVSGTSFRKRKRYTMIRIVDEKLDQLAAGILQHQHDQLEILRRLDEIKGLLVDMTH